LLALAEQDIPTHFPENVMHEAVAARETVALDGREDLRDLPLITIDPADARDHDDAVYAEADSDPKNTGGFHIWVAIADVATYISYGSEMDREARKRGNSVYLPDRVVPMLPERISNDLCSLRPDETRPCLAVKMTIDKTGKRREHQFMRGLMRSAARLSYQQAQAAFDGNPDEENAALHDSVLTPLWQAYQLMAKARDERGPLNLDLPERKIIMKNGQVTDIFIPERLEAMRVIEEMMVSANVCAAETLEKHNTPLVYRVHDSPATEKLHALAGFVKPLGVAIDLGQPMIPRLFNRLLAGAQDSDHSFMVQEAVLRTQSQAVYDPENIGHFGLNLSRYAHFTSPIRRYADLIVHRALIRALRLGDDGLHDSEIENLSGMAEHISGTERRAMLAERSAKDRYLSAYLSDKIDRVFEGRVSGLSRSGLFIKLSETGADGFIPISRLGAERFFPDADGLTLSGGTTGAIFRLGMPVRVRLLEATPLVGGLLLELEDSEANTAPPRRRVSRTATGRTRRAKPGTKSNKSPKKKKSTSRAGRRRAKALNRSTKKPS
jgi:ribonuclease R